MPRPLSSSSLSKKEKANNNAEIGNKTNKTVTCELSNSETMLIQTDQTVHIERKAEKVIRRFDLGIG